MTAPRDFADTPEWAADLVEEAGRAFAASYGREASHVVLAPGRVNLIGEHVDLHGGPMLPVAMARATVLACAPGEAGVLRVRSTARAGEAVVHGDDLAHGEVGDPWLARPAAVMAALADVDVPVPGLDALVTGDLPLGAGLSSSAALGVALCLAAEHAAQRRLDPLDRARVVQAAEHACGTPCGLMDPLVLSAARRDHAVHLDCRTGAWRHVPLPADVELVVVDSGQRHDLADGSYAERRVSCERAAELLGVEWLADADPDDVARLPDDSARRRVRHVVGEVRRVVDFERALRAGDVEAAGRVLAAGHASLRDDFEVSTHLIDHMADVLNGPPRDGVVLGARLTGGGFGGCLVVLTRRGGLACVRERLELSGLSVRAFATPAVDAARVLSR